MRYTIKNDDKSRTIPLGRVGENNYTELAFDIREWLRDYPNATITLAFQRPTDAAAYAVQPTISDGYAVVAVTATECAVVGIGKCQIELINGDTIAKSRIYSTACLASLDDGETPPAPFGQRLKLYKHEITMPNATYTIHSISFSAESQKGKTYKQVAQFLNDKCLKVYFYEDDETTSNVIRISTEDNRIAFYYIAQEGEEGVAMYWFGSYKSASDDNVTEL